MLGSGEDDCRGNRRVFQKLDQEIRLSVGGNRVELVFDRAQRRGVVNIDGLGIR